MQDLPTPEQRDARLGAAGLHAAEGGDDDQPVVFYHGSPMHEYLASVAPEELPLPMLDTLRSYGRRRSSSSEASPSESADTTGQPDVACKPKSRSSSRGSSSSSSHAHARRKRSSPSKHSPTRLAAEQQQQRVSTSSTTASENNPLLSEARERLNLLLVSYLSAPHYSALPPQDQECIDRETINAFLLDERFQRYGSRRDSVVGRHSSLSSARLGPDAVQAGQSFETGGEADRTQPKFIMTRKAQLVFLGLCSIALLTPTFASSSSSATTSTTPSVFNEVIASFLPDAVTSWPAWTGTLIRTAPGVVALTGIATLFARSCPSSSSANLANAASTAKSRQSEGDHNDRDAIILELKNLFAACKKLLDECTRLDITLEKGFTVIAELDRLVLSEDDQEQYEEEHASYGDESVDNISFESRASDLGTGSWQDLTTVEARLSASHPRQYLPSSQERSRNKKRLPALDVRRAIFSCLYTVQERLEKDLNAISTSLEIGDACREEDIDSMELVRLLDMYNCHPPSLGARHTARYRASSAVGEDEQAAKQLYRRTMARRSLDPTLYNDQQQATQARDAATYIKRLSGMYEVPGNTKRTDVASDRYPATTLAHEEQLARRASWAAFQPSYRRPADLPVHSNKPAPAPSSPSSILHNRSRNPALATPPRIRPQSIHFGGVLPSSAHNMNVMSSPLANGARESNSTIKRERRRRSEQLFPSNGLTSSLQLPEEEAVSHLRSSTSSNASLGSSNGSSAVMRMSTSSQGTSADPITAASNIGEMYDSPSRPRHMRRTSLGPLNTTSRTSLQQQHRRSRPLSMHELEYGKSLHRSSFPQFGTERPQLDEVPELDSTASHRHAAAAALERKWPSHAQNPLSSSFSASSSVTSCLHEQTVRNRPTSLLLQSSPIFPSAHARSSPVELNSPAASLKSRRSLHPNRRAVAHTKSKFALESLRESSQRVSTLERALVCHLLALKYSTLSAGKLRKILKLLLEVINCINSTINTETSSLSKAMWEEFEDHPQKRAGTEAGSTAPPTSVLLATPMTSSPLQSTPRRTPFVAYLPGSYPSSPMIEVDPATPPSDNGRQTSSDSFFPRYERHDIQSPNFAPRDPFSPGEQNGRKALTESHVQLNTALRTIATKLYMERQDLKAYFGESQGSVDDIQENVLEQMELRHESLKADLQALMQSWEEGRASFRQMKQGSRQRIQGPHAARNVTRRASSDGVSEYGNAEEEPSLLSTSAELEKYGSVSSILSSGNEDSLSTPALSPMSQATYQPPNIAELLLDDNHPPHLARYGMQEQLFEAYVGNEEGSTSRDMGKTKLSRSDRIALAKARRLEKEEQSATWSDPQANVELISELKDMMALLRSRNASVLPEQ